MSRSGGGGPCGACKFLRRKCVSGCIFAPHFEPEQGAGRFAAVHKVFGASNVSKLLARVPDHKRRDAVVTICYEAQARLRDPVYGCVSHIFALEQQVLNLQNQLASIHNHLSRKELPLQPRYIYNPPASSTFAPNSTLLPPVSGSRQAQAQSGIGSASSLIERSACDDIELQLLAQEYLSRCFTASQFQSSKTC